MLCVFSRRGDDRVRWDVGAARAGDVEAALALQEAERIFAEARANGGTAFRVTLAKPVERLERFDPEAEQIVVVPCVVGGEARFGTERRSSAITLL